MKKLFCALFSILIYTAAGAQNIRGPADSLSFSSGTKTENQEIYNKNLSLNFQMENKKDKLFFWQYDDFHFENDLSVIGEYSYAPTGSFLFDVKSVPKTADFLSPLYYQYEMSKPSDFQKVLEAVQFTGAAAMGIYHLWKYRNKK